MKKIWLLIILCCASNQLFAQVWDFKNVNLQGMGYVTGLIIHPNTTLAPNTVYARTDVGGVYRLDHANQRWIPLMDSYISRNNNGPIYDVESFAVDPQSSSTLYASLDGVLYYPSSAPGDIIKSMDKGQTWQSLNFVASNVQMSANGEWRGTGERLAIDPNNSDLIYYGSRTSGLWLKNGSAAWGKVGGGLPQSSSEPIDNYPGFTFVVFDKNSATSGNNSQTIYVGLWDSGIWQSVNGGATWANIGGETRPTRGVLDDSGALYVTFAASGGVQKYNGSAWSVITPPNQSGENFMGISLHPTTQSTLLASTFNRKLFRSLNSGTSWTELTMDFPAGSFPSYYNTYSPTYNYSFSPFDWGNTALTYDPNDPARVWMTNGYGIIKTDNIGTGTTSNWRALMENLEEIVCLDLKVPPAVGGADLIATTADMTGWRIVDRNVVPAVTIADFDYVAISTSSDYCQNQPQHLCYVGADQTNVGAKYSGYSTDNGATWQSFSNQTAGAGGVVAMSADNPQNMVWEPCCGAAPVFTLDGGATWTICTGITAAWQHTGLFWNAQNLVADRVNGNKFYYLNQSGLHVSTDRGANWTLRNNQFPAWHINTNIRSNPWQADEIWVTLARSADTITTQHRGLFHSTNGGQTFTELTTLRWVNFMAIGKGFSNAMPFLYAHGRMWGANYDAIYKSEDRGQTWIQVSSPAQSQFANINVLEADQRSQDLVYVGTGGRGIFWGAASNPLAVTYQGSLQAQSVPQGVLLFWSTALERDADRFEIQRSADGFSFEKIGEIIARGESSTLQQYSFLDKKPFTENNYYRLRQIDFNGVVSLSNIAKVVFQSPNFQVSPNPTTNLVVVSGKLSWSHIIVRNISGQVVRQFTANQPVLLAGLEPGLYAMEIFVEQNGVAQIVQIVVQ